jgi:hypothetical protein
MNNSLQNKVEVKPMDENVFWQIISMFDWNQQDEMLIMQPGIDMLSQFPVDDIYKFDDILSEKLYLLDGEPFGSNFMREPAKYLSVDMFLYRRCYVVARGKDFYENILANPRQGDFEETAEGMLYLSSYSYKNKAGSKDYDHQTKFNYETYSNSKAWEE